MTKAKTSKAAPKAPALKAIAKSSIDLNASAADVNKAIVGIRTRGAKLDNDIHSVAMACLNHAEKHGDVTLMGNLLLAVPKSTRRNALAQWAFAFGKFQPSTDKATMESMPVAFNKTAKTDLEAAAAKPFWDFRNVREGTSDWVFSSYIEGVMKTLARHAVGTDGEAIKAKAALDAMQGVTVALSIPAAPATLPKGVTADRRSPDRPVIAAPLAPVAPAVH